MKWLDRFLQRWRIAKVRPYLPPGARVLDVGCGDGALFRFYGRQISDGIGLDPALAEPRVLANARLLPGGICQCPSPIDQVDVITMLAVVEHLSDAERASLPAACAQWLKPGGHVVITVPSPLVDYVLAVLKAFRLIDGMHLHQHHGFNPASMSALFATSPLEQVVHRRFQLGLNHLFVYRKPST